MKRADIKRMLIDIRDDEWRFPKDLKLEKFVFELMEHIGDLESEFRDRLVLSSLYFIIKDEKISVDCMERLMDLSLSEDYLFYGVGKKSDDSVFKRTFTACVVANIMSANDSVNFMEKARFIFVFNKVMEYYRAEVDYRGYVKEKGWAHSTAHTADTLCSFALSKWAEKETLEEILKVIKEKICIDEYTYIDEEDERLINALIYVFNRDEIEAETISLWIESFKDIKLEDIEKDQNLRINKKTFLRSLYFRLMDMEKYSGLLPVIKKQLESLRAYY